MLFKRLELNGFKSFADPVTIDFTEGITCIVGPNGSGKSNISDALRWVLGEQSPKMLRGGKMDEVIFAGTQNRKAKGMAEVTLVIDNSDHSLPIDYAEVAITRRMYKSGESEYLINNNICRLKDIRELIMDTGIGVEGYSIIGQGKIADIVSNKMDSRREIFEEAAGVVKYRSKKEEAQRKLDVADINLSRVNDIINEIEGRIDKLKEDSEKATEYLDIKNKSRDIEINIILTGVKQADEKSQAVRDEILEIDKILDSLEQEGLDAQQAIDEAKDRLLNIESSMESFREDLSLKIDELHKLSESESINVERKKALEDDANRLSSEINEVDEKIKREEKNLEALSENVALAKEESEQLKKTLEAKIEERRKAEVSLTNASSMLDAASYSAQHLRVEQGRLCARLSLLEDLEKSYEGYNGGVKFLMEQKLSGIIGTLGSMLVVPRGYELAIETELGGKLQNIICKNDEVASNAIQVLKDNKAGRLTFLPVEDLKVQPPLNVDNLKNKKGFIGLASDLIKCEGGYQNVVEYVLGNVVLCDKLENAIAMSRSNNGPHKFVTLDGDIINMAGAMTGGSLKNNSSNILTRKAEKIDLIKAIKEGEAKIKEADQEIDKAKLAIENSGASQAKEDEIKLTMDNNSIKLKLENAANVEAMVKEGIRSLELSKETKIKDLESKKDQIDQIDKFVANFKELLKAKEVEKQNAEEKLSNEEKTKEELRDRSTALEEKARTAREKLYEAQQKKHDAQLRLTRFDTQTENLKDKLWDEFEMSYAQAVSHEDPNFVLASALKESKTYKDRLREIGDVNIGAIEEYKEVSERYSFLTAQREDTTKAIAELKSVISDMDRIIKEKFKENFDSIAENFETVFRDLFKGGHARLSMDDPANPLESAIEIEAQPPGKKLQNMNLLSGGEKTLTAIALMFAVLRAKPTPFCILDEIEAALDETNIDTVASYIRSFAGPQFTLITHQKLTMEYADVLYGVTMPESGVTQVLSLKLGDYFEV